MISINALQSEWTALSPAQQLAHWETFVTDLDAGAAGFHRYYRVLMPLWDEGDVPAPIQDATLAQVEEDLRADWQWRLETADFDAGVAPRVFSGIDLDLGEPPY